MKGKSSKRDILRVLGYVFRHYKAHVFVVLLGIIGSSLATLVMTLFMEVLIDDYIIPLTLSSVRDYSSLAFAIMRLSESMLAHSSYKRMQKRNQELLKAFSQAGKLLEKDGIVFDAANNRHMFLLQTQLNQMREAIAQEKAQRTKAFLKMWLDGLQNISKYGHK